METDYGQLYMILRSCVADALDCLPETFENFGSRWILQMALRRTEEIRRGAE